MLVQLLRVSQFVLLVAACIPATSALAQTSPGTIERTIPEFDAKPHDGLPIITPLPAPDEQATRLAQSFILSAVSIEGATVFTAEQLSPIFEPYVATSVGPDELDKIAAAITERYRQNGYLLSYASVPPQSVQSGIVRIKVIEGFIGNIRLAADGRSAAAVSKTFERLTKERPLRTETLERAILLARRTAGVVVGDIRISRSADDPARHVLSIAIAGQRTAALAYTDNRGTIENARMRGYASVSVASVATPGDLLQFDLFAIPYGHFHYIYGQLKGSAPLNADGLRLSVSASYSDQFQQLAGSDQDGTSRQLTAELSWPLILRRTTSLTGFLSLSDWKSEQKLGPTVSQRDRFQVARIGVEFVRSTSMRLGSRLVVSKGVDLTSGTERGDPLASRPSAGAAFTKINFNFDLTAPLGRKARMRTEAAAQFSTRSLLAPEEFALGGSRIGRAFDFNQLTGDHGFGAMAEVAVPVGDLKPAIRSAELFTFVDGGATFRRKLSPGLAKKQWLANAGAGARLSAYGLLWSGEIGLPLVNSGPDRDIRAFFSAMRQF